MPGRLAKFSFVFSTALGTRLLLYISVLMWSQMRRPYPGDPTHEAVTGFIEFLRTVHEPGTPPREVRSHAAAARWIHAIGYDRAGRERLASLGVRAA